MAIRPRITGIVEGLVVAAIVWVVSSLAAAYQSGLKAEEAAKVHLDPVRSALVALPPPLVISIAALLAFLCAFGALYLIHWITRDKGAALPASPPKADAEPDERDARIAELQRQLANAPSRHDVDKMRHERDVVVSNLTLISLPAILYRRAVELREQLTELRAEMDKSVEHLTAENTLSDWLKESPQNKARFANDYRPKLVRFALDLKQEFGWVIPGLTDEKLSHDVFGGNGVTPYIEGVKDAEERLGLAVLEAVRKLNVERRPDAT